MSTKQGRMALILLGILLLIGLLLALYPKSSAAQTPPKKLIVAVGEDLSSTDPSAGFGGDTWAVTMNYAEYLINRAPSGDLGPGLATSWKVSPDGKQIDFTLRKGVKFHSGDLLTTKDIAFSFERGRAKNQTVRSFLNSVERLEIIDDYRFKLHLKEVDVLFIPRQCSFMVVSKSYYDRVGEDRFVREPVGTGPYKVVRYVPGEYLDIERFDDYWGEKPRLGGVKEARFLFIPDETTKAAKLKAGEIDLISGCPYPLARDIEKSPEFKIVKLAVEHSTLSVMFNNQNPKTPWYDRRVRLAMAYAVDCDAIIKNVLFGIPHRYAFLAPYELGYDPELKPYPYDPKRARELLAEAGYPNGFGFKLYWPVGGRNPMLREVAETITSYFKAVGLRPELVSAERLAFESKYRASKGPEAEYVCYRGVGRAGLREPSEGLVNWNSRHGAFSISYNPELEKVIAEARATVDDTKRAELIKKGVRIIHEEVLTFPVFNTVGVYAMKKNIDFKPTLKIQFELLLVKDMTIR